MSGITATGSESGSSSAADPFSQIAAPPPAFTKTQACEIVVRHYGISATAVPLVSERDQNFLMTAAGKPVGILKIANAAEPEEVTRFQIDALKHVESVDGDFNCVPRVLATTSGTDSLKEASESGTHIIRLVSYLPGVPAGSEQQGTWLFARSLGEVLARLNLSLHGFRHAGQGQTLLWDMQRALALRALLHHVDDAKLRALLEATLADFECLALPAFASLPHQVIHNDANPANILLETSQASRVSGLIDFGDMLLAPRIVELAVAGAYLRVLAGGPLDAICELLAGYHRALPLQQAELEILPCLLRTRLATTLVILNWRQSLRDPADDYLRATHASENSALSFLQRLTDLTDADALRTFREVCTS